MLKKFRAKAKDLHRQTFIRLSATPAEIEIAASKVWPDLVANILIMIFGVLLIHNYWPAAIWYAVWTFIFWSIFFVIAARDKKAIYLELAAEFRDNDQGGMSA
ncbi:MAG TPA: hypothetical protein DIW43_10460 [Spongiibacteraceae bacterium]|nr:hypothetical protein [Spongiibacteraceae bacterium]HCS27867.1 hypothetical protein [Spongiibacteraceae bacterium]